jgi:hypothetical protein
MDLPVSATGEPLAAEATGEAIGAGVAASVVGVAVGAGTGAVVAVGLLLDPPPHAARMAATVATIAIPATLDNHRLTVINALLLEFDDAPVVAAARKAYPVSGHDESTSKVLAEYAIQYSRNEDRMAVRARINRLRGRKI